jgi:hypothetical protein
MKIQQEINFVTALAIITTTSKQLDQLLADITKAPLAPKDQKRLATALEQLHERAGRAIALHRGAGR